MNEIRNGETSIDAVVEAYIKTNGLDIGPLATESDMIRTLLVSGMAAGIAILSNRIAKTAVQQEASQQLQNVSDNIATLSTETLIKLEQLSTPIVGTA